jgi:hypothetical protein
LLAIDAEPALTAPAVQPAMPMREVRQVMERLLPGVDVRRRLLWRYTVSWTKPR